MDNEFSIYVRPCSLRPGKLYKQIDFQVQYFRISGSRRWGHDINEYWYQNNNIVRKWPPIDKVYMFIERTINRKESSLLWSKLDYVFLCEEDIWMCTMWDDNTEGFDSIWEEMTK